MKNTTRIHKNGRIIAHGGDADSARIFSGIKSGIVNPSGNFSSFMKPRSMTPKKRDYRKVVADPLSSEPVDLSVGI